MQAPGSAPSGRERNRIAPGLNPSPMQLQALGPDL